MSVDIEQFRRDFDDFRVDVERRFGDMERLGLEKFQEALNAIPAGVQQELDDEKRGKEEEKDAKLRRLRYREVFYIGAGTVFAGWDHLRSAGIWLLHTLLKVH